MIAVLCVVQTYNNYCYCGCSASRELGCVEDTPRTGRVHLAAVIPASSGLDGPLPLWVHLSKHVIKITLKNCY